MEENWNQILSALRSNKNFGSKWSEILNNHMIISMEEAKKLTGHKIAAHVFLWAKNDQKLWNISQNASIMMQMRFDGSIGFPGGLIDPDDSNIVHGLNRELEEELNLAREFYCTEQDYFFTSVSKSRKLILHFYTKEVSYDQFKEIEMQSLSAEEYGKEVLGIIRPPLYKLDSNKGFGVFILNNFIGNALIQLLKSLLYLKILQLDQLLDFIKNC